MKILNPAALKRADLNRMGKYLRVNKVDEVVIKREGSTQTIKWIDNRLYVSLVPKNDPLFDDPTTDK